MDKITASIRERSSFDRWEGSCAGAQAVRQNDLGVAAALRVWTIMSDIRTVVDAVANSESGIQYSEVVAKCSKLGPECSELLPTVPASMEGKAGPMKT